MGGFLLNDIKELIILFLGIISSADFSLSWNNCLSRFVTDSTIPALEFFLNNKNRFRRKMTKVYILKWNSV